MSTNRQIYEKALMVRRKYETEDGVISMLSVAQALGVRIIKNCDVRVLKSTESGRCYFYPEKNRWYIIYDEKKSRDTCRFTVAHELGHVLLNHAEECRSQPSNPSAEAESMFSRREQEAELFARALLCGGRRM